MFCKNCGAVVTGKYCSCCGARVRTYGQEFFLALKRKKRMFVNARYDQTKSFIALRTADFCWDTVQRQIIEPLRDQILNSNSDIDGDNLLNVVNEKATLFYAQVYSLILHCL